MTLKLFFLQQIHFNLKKTNRGMRRKRFERQKGNKKGQGLRQYDVDFR